MNDGWMMDEIFIDGEWIIDERWIDGLMDSWWMNDWGRTDGFGWIDYGLLND
jgi:hypothetical protein